MAKRSKQKRMIEDISCVEVSSSLMPDYIEGVLTEPNQNPVIFHVTHQKGEGLKIDHFCPKVYWACFLAANVMGIVVGATAAFGYIATSLGAAGLGLGSLIEVMSAAILEGGLAAVGAELAVIAGPAAGALIIGAAAWCSANTDYHYNLWRETIEEAKREEDDTFIWYEEPEDPEDPPIQHIDDKWEYLESHMEWIFETTSCTIVEKRYQQDMTGKYIETTALNPTITSGLPLSNAVTVSVRPYTILHATDIYKQEGGGADKKIEK